MCIYEKENMEPVEGDSLINRDEIVNPFGLRNIWAAPAARQPSPRTVMSMTDVEDTGDDASTLDPDVFEGETFEELADNIKECIFGTLDTLHEVIRMSVGYWDCKTSKSYFIGEKIKSMKMDIDIVRENLRQLEQLKKNTLDEEEAGKIYADASFIKVDFYFTKSDCVDHYEHFQVVK